MYRHLLRKPIAKFMSILNLTRVSLNKSPLIQIHTYIDISVETLGLAISRVKRVALPGDEREPRQQERSIASKVESAMKQDEGYLSTACTRSLVVETESNGVAIPTLPSFFPVARGDNRFTKSCAKIYHVSPTHETLQRYHYNVDWILISSILPTTWRRG